MTDRYEHIRAALVMGPTPGPRKAVEQSVIGPQDLSILFAKVTFSVGISGSHSVPIEEAIANAALAAACDPDTIQALLDECDALRAEVKQLAASEKTCRRIANEKTLEVMALREAIVRADLQIGDGHIEAARITLHDAMDAAIIKAYAMPGS